MIPKEILHHGDDPSIPFERLSMRLAEEVVDHFWDYAAYDQAEHIEYSRARKKWIKALVGMAEQVAPADWEHHWSETAALVDVDVQRQHAEAVADWERQQELGKAVLEELEQRGLAQATASDKRILKLAEELVRRPRPDLPETTISQSEGRVLAMRGIVAELLFESLASVHQQAGRIVEILEVLRSRDANHVIRAFLWRCAQCYIHGMYPETVVMVASAVEQHLERFLPASALVEYLNLDSVRKVTVGKRLQACERLGLLSEHELRELRDLVYLRNDIVHMSPNAGATQMRALQSLSVLQKLLDRMPQTDHDR
jgi:hypothetical protein